MKNKLTQEEQALHNKLDSVEFNYQDAHWAEMQEMLGKKGFFSKYGTVMKAAAVVVSISSIVYWMAYDEAKLDTAKSPIVEQVKVDENATQNIIKENPTNISTTSDISKEIRVEETPSSVQKTEGASSASPIKKVKSTNNTPADSREENVIATSPEEITVNKKDKPSNITSTPIKLSDLTVSGKVCKGETVAIETNFNTGNDAELLWFVNGSKLASNGTQLKIELTDGKTVVKAKLIHNKKVVDEKETSIFVAQGVEIDFRYNDLTNVFYDFHAELNASPKGLNNYQWIIDKKLSADNGQQITHPFGKKGIYDVTLMHTSEAGCISKTTKPVAIEQDFKFFDNAFSPNGDGMHETFIPKIFTDKSFTDLGADFQMSILDQNGDLIYQTNSVNDPWNGRKNNNGALMPKGTYIWKIKIQSKKGVVKYFTERVKIVGS